MHIAPPVNTAIGDYPLVLQSFDNNGSVKSTFKEEVIVITIVETEYLRDTAVPSSTEVTQGDTNTLYVEKIYSVYDIANVLDIKLR